MKKLSRLLIVTAALAAPIAAIAADTGNSTSVDASDPNRIVATLRGTLCIAGVKDDKIELRNGAVFVNERSYGSVPANAEIKYIVTPTERLLLVNGKRRAAPPASK